MSHTLPAIVTLLLVEAKPIPDMVILVPPPVPPLRGSMVVMVGVRARSNVNAEAEVEVPDGWATTTSQTSVGAVLFLLGERQPILEVVISWIVQVPEQTETVGKVIVSKPVPVITRGDPPPKLPLDGVTELISREDVKVVMLSERPSAGLFTTTLYSPPGSPARSQLTEESDEMGEVQAVDPMVTVAESPKPEPVISMVVAPEAIEGVTVLT